MGIHLGLEGMELLLVFFLFHLLLVMNQLLNLLHHVVEGGNHPGDILLSAHFHPGIQVAVLHLPHALCQMAQRNQQPVHVPLEIENEHQHHTQNDRHTDK